MAQAAQVLPPGAAQHLGLPENPTLADADAAFANDRNGIVAPGGGSVLDTAKLVAAPTGGWPDVRRRHAGGLDRIGLQAAPFVAIPTTVDTSRLRQGVGARVVPVRGR